MIGEIRANAVRFSLLNCNHCLAFPSARFPWVQDLVHALGWVKVALSDVQNILFDLDEDDLGELAQVGESAAEQKLLQVCTPTSQASTFFTGYTCERKHVFFRGLADRMTLGSIVLLTFPLTLKLTPTRARDCSA